MKSNLTPHVLDAIPAMADVFSGSVPRPAVLRRGDDVTTWAQRSTAVRRLAQLWGVDAATVQAFDTQDAELGEFLGDVGAYVILGGRLVALNVDGTRGAWRE